MDLICGWIGWGRARQSGDRRGDGNIALSRNGDGAGSGYGSGCGDRMGAGANMGVASAIPAVVGLMYLHI